MILQPVRVTRAVVISLSQRPDRLSALLRDWALRPGLPRLGIYAALPDPIGARGCLRSHRAVLRAHSGPLMVVEDDAVFSPAFTWPLLAPADWQVLWLGGEHRVQPQPAAPGWVRPCELLRTHCYLVRDPQAVARALAGVDRLDPHLAALPVPQYAQAPFTVGQRAGRSDITGRTREHDQFWINTRERT